MAFDRKEYFPQNFVDVSPCPLPSPTHMRIIDVRVVYKIVCVCVRVSLIVGNSDDVYVNCDQRLHAVCTTSQLFSAADDR